MDSRNSASFCAHRFCKYHITYHNKAGLRLGLVLAQHTSDWYRNMYIYLIGKLNSTEKKMKSKKCFQEYLFTSNFQLPFCCECIVISQNDSLQEKQIILIWIFFDKDFSCYQWIGDLLLSSSIFISIPYWVIHRYIMDFFLLNIQIK